MNADKLNDLMSREEELDPELQRWVETDGPFGTCIKHPLVYSIVHHPRLNAFVRSRCWNE